jgi:hypothetical protein
MTRTQTQTITSRNSEYKKLLKGDERELRRLRRQLRTYEALATGKWVASVGAATQGGTQPLGPQQAPTPPVVELDNGEVLAVTQDSIRMLWQCQQQLLQQLSHLQNEAAQAIVRAKVCAIDC